MKAEATDTAFRAPHTDAAPISGKVSSQKQERASLRILHVFNYVGVGGTELTALRLVRSLQGGPFENRLCGLRGADHEMLSTRFPEVDVVTGTYQQRDSRSQFAFLREAIRAYRPQVVHSRNWGGIEAVFAAKSMRVPVVIHSEHGYELETMNGFPLRRRLLRHVAYRMADSLFTVSNQLRTYHAQQGWVSDKVFQVIPNGIDLPQFAAGTQAKSASKQSLGVAANRFVLGTIGRMVGVKDQATLLRAAEQLVAKNLDVHVLLIGTGPHETLLRNQVNSSPAIRDRVTFVGQTQKIADFFRIMDAFVLPSLAEGMSNVLLEAMASGVPAVATEVGGNAEIMEHGVSGLLFPPGHAELLAQRVAELYRDPDLRRRYADCARRRVEDQYSLARMVDAYSRLYMGLAKERINRRPV